MSNEIISLVVGLVILLVAFKVLKGIVKLAGLALAVGVAVALYYGMGS